MSGLAPTLYKAYHYFLKGEPFPVDLQMALNGFNIDPAELEERFTDGSFPEGAEVIDPEDDPEDTDYSEVQGSIQDLLFDLRRLNGFLTAYFKERT